MDKDKPTRVIGEKTGLSLTLFIAALTMAVTGTAFVLNAVNGLEQKIDRSLILIKQLHVQCLTHDQFNDWLQDARDANPTIKIPRLSATVEHGGSMRDEAAPAKGN